ncbi:alpha/beta fold hydrolase [Rhodococcoides fascians]|uniref:2-(Acetamidomethylene)succinate hydrolase n=1 Tax=Rhodococcoides fascians TaxID=1828 RepID=A0A143QKU1_RHOFA|nr:alpha/beta hydrolase [Rhodococcus fascians]AMY23406.1 2-(acetamidomethylene)succinate hydrolase [Rhodococcus fascians]OZC38939.1 alpha/beta hydrolase [Rhodococcus fascians]
MTETLAIGDNTLAYDLTGDGPLVVLAHGIGDSRHAYRFLAPALVEAGYRVANLDIRGCGQSSIGWDGYSRTDIAGDLVALVRHLGGPAVIIGHSISGGAATIAAATAPELIVGLIELAPFTRAVTYSMGALLTNKRYRRATTLLGRTLLTGSVNAWQKYLDLAYPTKPADWDDELARIVTVLREPGRAKALQAMCKSAPTDAGAQLGNVHCPALVVEGDADPDFADPRAEGDRIVADLPAGIGEVAVLDGVGHYPHAQAPNQILTVALPFLAKALHHA